MKKIHQKCIMKAVSGMLAASMSLSLFTTIPVSAETSKTTYNYEGYSVEYNITKLQTSGTEHRPLNLRFPTQVMNLYSTGHSNTIQTAKSAIFGTQVFTSRMLTNM